MSDRRFFHWKISRAFLLMLIALLGTVVSLAGYWILQAKERAMIQAQVEAEAVRAIDRRFRADVVAIYNVGRFIRQAKPGTPQEFQAIAERTLSGHLDLCGVYWIPRVSPDQVDAHERAARSDVAQDYKLRSLPPEGGPITIEGTPDHDVFPLLYAHPSDGHENALGLDLQTVPRLQQTLQRAAEDGGVAVTAPTVWPTDGDQGKVFIVFRGMFDADDDTEPSERRPEDLLGFTGVVIRGDRMLEAALDDFPEGIDIQIFDEMEVGPRKLACAFNSQTNRAQFAPLDTLDAAQAFESYPAVDLDVPGHKWSVQCYPTSTYWATQSSKLPIVTLGFGLLMTALLTTYGNTLLGRTEQVERLVVKRTAELRQANTSLELEIAVRKQTEQDLAYERFLLTTLLEYAPDFIYFKDPESRFLRVSRALASHFGLQDPADVTGKTDSDYFAAEHADRYRDDERRVMESGQALLDQEEEQVRSKSDIIYVSTSKVPLRSPDGDIVGTFGISRDITDRKRSEKVLRDSEALYASLVENLPVQVVRKDLQGRFTFANRLMCDELGLSPTEIIGKSDRDLFPEQVAAEHCESDRYVLQTGEVTETFEEVMDGDHRRTIQVIKCPVRNASGRTIGTQAIRWDITQRKAAEQAAEYERFLLHSLMDSIPDSVYFKDSTGRYIRINRAKAIKSGLLKPDDAIGKSDADFFPPEHAQRARLDEERIQQTGESIIGKEELLVWPTGERCWVSTTKLPLRNKQGEIVGTFGISHDITEQKRAAEQYRLSKEAAEAASQAKSDFLANMSHEIRTPLNAVIGMTELVLESDLTDSQSEYLRMVLDSGESLSSVLNDILDFSKIEAGKLTLEHAEFDVRQSLGNVMETLTFSARRKGLELSWAVAADVPARVVGDASRLRQVVVNLVGNAIKFTAKGEIFVRVSRQPQVEGDEILEFAVRDTGIGVAKEKQQSIFSEFEQADTSTTRRFGGTGLGLAICARLTGLMGGQIWVDSQVGQGSTFFFTVRFGTVDRSAPASALASLPEKSVLAANNHSSNGQGLQETAGVGAMSAQPAPAQPLPVRPTTLPPMRILLAEDSPVNQKLAVGLLQRRGYHVHVANHGLEALAAIQAERFDLVLMDIQMPEMDGIAATKAIRALEEETGRHIPIVAMTAHAMQGDRQRCLDAGMDAYVAKPIRAQQILEAIVRLVGGDRRDGP